MKSRLSSMVALLLIAVTGSLVAQDLDIAGRVYVQSTNEPLAGANIRIKGTYVGTTSDAGGGFRLQVREAGDATVIVSYLGYKTVESYVTRTSGALSIGMEEDVLKTSEVVVTGLASSVKRENLANAVATVSAKELVGAPAQTLDQALAGKFAGISISQNTGAPGGGIYIDLRGVSTIEGSTQPLFVIDGVIISNSEIQSGIDLVTKAAGAGSRRPQGQPASRIADINPYDIENIEVLKGASAAAIYGAKATNGVVIITTKRGGTGEARVEINQLVGMNNLLRKIGTRKFTRQTAIDTYGAAYGPIFDQNGGRFIDYEEEMYGETGMIYETTVSTRGGTESTHYFVSGVSRTEDGIIQNTGYSRYGGRLNLNHRITDRANVSLFTNFLRTESNRAITGNDNTNTTLGFSLAFTPSFLNILPKNGVYPDHTLNPSNPFHTRDVLKNTEQVNRSIAAVQLTWNLLRTNEQLLDFSAQAGVDYFTLENKVLSPPELQFERNSSLPGASVVQQTSNTNSNLYLNLVHNYTSGPSATFRTSAGLQFEALDRNSVLNEARGLIVTQTNVDQAASVNALQEVTIQRDWGFFVQEEVNLSDQYFLTAGVRGDRSSTVGDTKSMLFFPKGSASVRLSKF
ncbi:MAG: TonB-dependent receptor, partial [Ignavibacteriales bacterium]|nr:TonB-dependent receptor [Ignavibacteriales bacterium]